MVLANNAKKKANTNKVNSNKKQDKYFAYNLQYSFTKFNNNNKLRAVDPQTDENKVLKPKVLDSVRDLFNELYYICKDKYSGKKDGLNTKNKNFFTTKN